jgi:hypothetical protein
MAAEAVAADASGGGNGGGGDSSSSSSSSSNSGSGGGGSGIVGGGGLHRLAVAPFGVDAARGAAMKGATAVVSTRQGGPDVIVDAQLALLRAAKAAGARRFIPSDDSYNFLALPEGLNVNSDWRRALAHAARKEETAQFPVVHVMQGIFTDQYVLGFLGMVDGQNGVIRMGDVGRHSALRRRGGPPPHRVLPSDARRPVAASRLRPGGGGRGRLCRVRFRRHRARVLALQTVRRRHAQCQCQCQRPIFRAQISGRPPTRSVWCLPAHRPASATLRLGRL